MAATILTTIESGSYDSTHPVPSHEHDGYCSGFFTPSTTGSN